MFGRRKTSPPAPDAHGISTAAARVTKWPTAVKAPDPSRVAPLLEPDEQVAFVTCGIVGRPMCHVFVTDRRVLAVDTRRDQYNVTDMPGGHITGVSAATRLTKTEVVVSAPQGDTTIGHVPADDVPLLVAAIRKLTSGAGQ